MANYYASARTNYVRVTDLEGLKEVLSRFPIGIHSQYAESDDPVYCFLCEDADGSGWPYCAYDEEDREILFSWENTVMPFVKVGEVLVVQEVGAEKLRYLVGYSEAYIRREDGRVESCHINIDDIYDKAKKLFDVGEIADATY